MLAALLPTFGLDEPWPQVIRVVAVLAVAAVVLRFSDRLVRWVVARNDRRYTGVGADTAELAVLKRRETAISLLRTSLRYGVIVIALRVVLQVLTGAGTVPAVAGASLLILIIGFSAQRSLTVTRALIEEGLPSSSVFAAAFGSEQAVASNADAEGRVRNRRVEMAPTPRPSNSIPGHRE